MRIALFSSFVLALSACFHPDLSQVTLTCEAGSTPCPDGLVCQAGVCTDPNRNLPDAAADLVVSPADLAMPVLGCARGAGFPVGDAYACTGPFKSGQALGLCAAGFVPCTAAPKPDLSACNKLQGFFVANVVGRYNVAGDLTGVKCTGNDFYRVVYGCGNPIQGRTAATSCGSFWQLIDCQDTSANFRCPVGPFPDISQLSNPFPLDGVLCCRS